jgi:hypothetical protein
MVAFPEKTLYERKKNLASGLERFLTMKSEGWKGTFLPFLTLYLPYIF